MDDLEKQALATLEKLLYQKEHPKFKENQMPIIRSLLNGKDTLAILPTGSGKSVCYQVPAFMLPGLTVVISPLISLIEDQVDDLLGNPNEEICKKVACISSDLIADRDGKHRFEKNREAEETEESRSRIWKKVLLDASKGAYKLLYVTAERLRLAEFVRFMRNTEIGLFVVDEAHCVSMYGYEFRPRYLEICRIFAKSEKSPPVAAFTATATKAVTEDIVTYLDMKKPKIITANTKTRGNLHYSILRVSDAVDRKKKAPKKPPDTETIVFNQKMRALTRFLSDHPDESGFVYCATVKTVNKVFKSLSKAGYSVTRYYAALGKSPKTRKDADGNKGNNFKQFLNGEKKIIVSTTALGMGINKTDVRFVVHFNLPLCMENYAQESGRAGRDGEDADCMLLYHPSDRNTCERLVNEAIAASELSESDRAERKRIADLRLERVQRFAETGEGKSSDELQDEMLAYFDDFDPRGGAFDLDHRKLDAYTAVRKIDVLYCNRTNVARLIRMGVCHAENLKVASSSKYTVSFRITDENGETYDRMLSYFDMMIADAIYTLQFHRKKKVTARAVMEILAGDPSLTLRPDRKERVEQRIRKMLRMHIEIDRRKSVLVGHAYENEGKAPVLSGKFLPLTENAKGGFDFIDGAPFPLYEYAERTNGQFYTFPFKVLKDSARPASDGNLALLHYLLCRIDMMSSPQKKKKTNNLIKIDTIYEFLDISFPEDPYERKRKKEAIFQKITEILDNLKAVNRIEYWSFECKNGVERFSIIKWSYDPSDSDFE